jgi:hypothetical protein
VLERKRRCSAMWTKRVADLSDITRICELKLSTPPSGCYETPGDFSSQSTEDFSRDGNIPIVATLDSEIMSGGSSR